MGGGAGVTWTVEFEYHTYPMRWDPINSRLTMQKHSEPKIDRFNAQGYQDGMNDVRGDMLKVNELTIDIPEKDYKWLLDAMANNENHLFDVSFEYEGHKWFETMTWGGYVRGKIEDIFPLDLQAQVTVEGVGDYTADLTVEPVDMEDFKYWYEDVFQTYSSGLEDERKKLQDKIDELEGMDEPDGATLEALQEELDEIPTDEQWFEDHWDDIQMNYGADKR